MLKITFDRIGRNHEVKPLEVKSTDPNEVAEAVHKYARPHLASRDYEVHVDLQDKVGFISCGWHNGGEFKIEEVT